jgi:hypothetical protein
MLKKNLYIIIILLSVTLVTSIFFLLKKDNNDTGEAAKIINHQIIKLNKMIVIEQNYSAFKTHKSSNLGALDKYFNFDDKEIVLYITAKAQVTYNMKLIQITLDSVNKKIIINKLPNPQIEIYPSVEIYHMQQGFINSYNKTELQQIINAGKEEIAKKVQHSTLKKEAHLQFIANIKELYTIASLYDWKVENQSTYSDELLKSLKNNSTQY